MPRSEEPYHADYYPAPRRRDGFERLILAFWLTVWAVYFAMAITDDMLIWIGFDYASLPPILTWADLGAGCFLFALSMITLCGLGIRRLFLNR